MLPFDIWPVVGFMLSEHLEVSGPFQQDLRLVLKDDKSFQDIIPSQSDQQWEVIAFQGNLSQLLCKKDPN